MADDTFRGHRSQAREAALKFLYQLDITRDPLETCLGHFLEHQEVPSTQKDFFISLVQGVHGKLEAIDDKLHAHATNWALDRMAIVDRNILRLAVFELLHDVQTPAKVVINEAVELAKLFGAADSSRFVNGVLDAILKETVDAD